MIQIPVKLALFNKMCVNVQDLHQADDSDVAVDEWNWKEKENLLKLPVSILCV
ncbi:unnamed protein product, partial [Heterotrigona itama]